MIEMRGPTSLIWLLLVATGGCSSRPPPTLYSLSSPADPTAGISIVTGKPAIELQPVTIPDYLDTSDILLRSGQNELKISDTGRWAGRLSDELNHALRADLASRLPDVQIAAAQPPGKPALQILVTVDAFDIRPDGRFVLSATWTVLNKNTLSVLISQRGAFITSAKDEAGAAGNASIVSAMAAAVGQLADAIAAGTKDISL